MTKQLMGKVRPYIIFSCCLLSLMVASQEEGEKSTKGKHVDFGIPFERTISLPNNYNVLYDIELQILDIEKLNNECNCKKKRKELRRAYYHASDKGLFGKYFSTVRDHTQPKILIGGISVHPKLSIDWEQEKDNTYKVYIPTLEVNQFYRLKITYLDAEGIYANFVRLHDEGNDNWFKEPKQWMKVLGRISKRQNNFPITYFPTEYEMKRYKTNLQHINFPITPSDTTKLRNIANKYLPILNFSPPLMDKLISFSNWINNGDNDFDETERGDFSGKFFDSELDYINFYEFYEAYLKQSLDNKSLKGKELVDLVDSQIPVAISNYPDDILPNFYQDWDNVKYTTEDDISTFADSFDTNYKRRLVMDFGLLGYSLGDSFDKIQGTPFVGVNLAFEPVNKDVQMQLSKLSPMQRTSFHVGITTNALAETGRREDFFDKTSLMLGFSYKVFSQATRLNMGSILYNQIDAKSGDKSLAFAPYLGLSIDLEIREWLTDIGNVFKPK